MSEAEVCISGGTASRLTAGPYGSNVQRLQLSVRPSWSQVHRRALMLLRHTAPHPRTVTWFPSRRKADLL